MLPPPEIGSQSPTIALHDIVITTTSLLLSPSTSLPMSTSSLSPSLTSSPSSTSILLSALSSVTSTPSAGPSSGPKTLQGPNGECELLGPFALFIQAALGLLAMLSLVWKRSRERPQRPIRIWAFDVSKQVVGSVLVHAANLLMSMLSAGQFSVKPKVGGEVAPVRRDTDDEGAYRPNPCSFYLLNLAIDTTIGIPILIVLLRLLTAAFLLTPLGSPPESIQSGNYGRPPRTLWWIKQSLIYFLGLMGMKICVLFIFELLPWISRVGDWALRWTEGNEMLQVGFVMLLFPVIMNALQYYIIDGFIKDQRPENGHEQIPSEDEDDDNDGENEDDDHDEPPQISMEDHTVAQDKGLTPRREGKGSTFKAVDKLGDYEPTTDGDDSPTAVGSSSNGEDGKSTPSSSEGPSSESAKANGTQKP
ncbi:MAG: hypothetical protein M1817_002146 [Caeruleum heppii]|nr:MAG: hypothetical protein M1817_002146 [Caeruleum heppii]